MSNSQFKSGSLSNSDTGSTGKIGSRPKSRENSTLTTKGKRGHNRRSSSSQVAPSQAGSTVSFESSAPTKQNDISWHAKDARWLENAAKIGYGLPIGSRINYGSAGGTFANTTSLPGVMTFIFTPTYGMANDQNAPLNRAAVDVFNQVRRRISGARSYERTDLMKYFLAVDSLYMFYSFISRAYKMLNLTSHLNYFIPKALVESMGLNYDSLIKKRTNLYDLVRQFRVDIGRYCIPTVIDIYKRHRWMVDHIWKDADTIGAQFYMFLPRTFYRWHDVYDGTTKPGLAPIAIPWIEVSNHGLGTLDDLWDIYNALLGPLTNNSDIAQMSADVASVYGDDIWIPEDYPSDAYYTPEYSAEALMQIHNLSMIGDFELDVNRNVIFEDPSLPNKYGYLLSDFRFTSPYCSVPRPSETNWVPGNAAFMANRLLDFDESITTPANTMFATRLLNIPVGINGGRYWQFDTLSTEVVNYARIHFFGSWNVADAARRNLENIAVVNPWDVVHYETERIFTSMVDVRKLTSAGPDFSSPILGCYQKDWSLSNHAYLWVQLQYPNVSWDDCNNPLINVMPIFNERAQNELRNMLAKFAYHPPVAFSAVYVVYDSSGVIQAHMPVCFTGYDQDVDVCGVITPDDLVELNTVDVASEFDINR